MADDSRTKVEVRTNIFVVLYNSRTVNSLYTSFLLFFFNILNSLKHRLKFDVHLWRPFCFGLN